MLVSAMLVSTSFPVGKAITPFMDPVLLTLIRFCLAALLFAPYVGRRFGLANPAWRRWVATAWSASPWSASSG